MNEDPKDTMLREMQDEISRLKALLEARKSGHVAAPLPSGMLDSAGQPHSTEGEHMMGIDSIQGDGTVVEQIVEREEVVDTGIKPEHLDDIRRQAEAEHARLIEQYRAQDRSEEEARRMAEEATQQYEKELRRKAEILAKENAQLESLQKALAEREAALQKGQQGLDAAMRIRERLRATEEELQRRRAEQEAAMQAMQEAEEQRLDLVDAFTNSSEELRAKTAQLKKLWAAYQQQRADLMEVQAEFDLERADLLDTIRSLDRQIKLKTLVMEEFIPPHYAQLIENHAVYDHVNDGWIIRGVEFAGNNIQRSEMMFGGMPPGMAGPGAGPSGHSPQRRMFKREFGPMGGHMAGGMAHSAMAVAASSPSNARFFNYSQVVQQKERSGDGDGKEREEKIKAKKKKRDK